MSGEGGIPLEVAAQVPFPVALRTHSHEAFLVAVEAAGLAVDQSEPCNRGCSDMVIARKPGALRN